MLKPEGKLCVLLTLLDDLPQVACVPRIIHQMLREPSKLSSSIRVAVLSLSMSLACVHESPTLAGLSLPELSWAELDLAGMSWQV